MAINPTAYPTTTPIVVFLKVVIKFGLVFLTAIQTIAITAISATVRYSAMVAHLSKIDKLAKGSVNMFLSFSPA